MVQEAFLACKRDALGKMCLNSAYSITVPDNVPQESAMNFRLKTILAAVLLSAVPVILAQDAGTDVKKGTEKVADTTGHDTKVAAKDTAKGTEKVAKKTGSGIKKATKATGHEVKKAGEKTDDAVKK